MKKVVLKLDLFDEKIKQKAMKNVSGISGVDSIAMDMKDKKLTVTGDIDPVTLVSKLRKLCHTEIVSVGPAKEPEKKKDDKAAGGGGGGGGGGDKKKEDDKKKSDDKGNKKDSKDDAPKLVYPPYLYPYPYYIYQQQQQPYYGYDHPPTPYYSKVVHDENPNCVIS